jgi:hypothetical protein
MTAAKRAIPMFDYRLSDAPIRETIQRAMNAVLQSGQLILGDQVQSFEENFAKFLGPNGMTVGVGNGTDALAIALRALRIGSGDEVITVPNTAIPTVSAIRMVGATPVFVDVSDATCLMQVESVEQKNHESDQGHCSGPSLRQRSTDAAPARNRSSQFYLHCRRLRPSHGHSTRRSSGGHLRTRRVLFVLSHEESRSVWRWWTVLCP